MPNLLEEKDWKILIDRINDGKCTPFLGAGACYGVLPLGGEIAEAWAQESKYPFEDAADLVRVAQFVAIENDHMTPKERIVKEFRKHGAPDFKDPMEPHRALAELPLPVYITTNYDDFMVKALQYRYRDAKRELCRWNEYVKKHPSIFEDQPAYQPSVANPIVFHLHGHDGVVESLVLTEDDYMDFLVNISRDPILIPPLIERALSGTTLLFVGYRMADWNFRVLLRGMARFMEKGLQRLNVAVMLPPGAAEASPEKAQEYLTKYYKNIDVRVYWGTVQEFIAELKQRRDS